MTRPLRIHLDNGFYHVTLRGNHQQPIFRQDADRHLLNAIVARTLQKYGSRIHAYCWMTNHLHFLIQVGVEPLGDVMRQIAAGYARAYQLKLETSGHLFERRYHARLVQDDAYLLAVMRYIHRNPVAAGIISRAALYRWSSHAAFAGGVGEPWLTTDFILGLFARDRAAARAAYRRFMDEGDPDWSPDDDAPPPDAALQLMARERRGGALPLGGAHQTLAALVTETCQRFGVAAADLYTCSRDARIVLARGWLAREAVGRRVASLAEVARLVGRDRATLRYAMRQLAKSDVAA